MPDTTAFPNESLGACHLYALVVNARALGARAQEYESANAAWHMSDSWHGRKDAWGNHLAVDINAHEGDELAEQRFFRSRLVPIAKARGLAVTCGIGPSRVRNHSIGDGLHLHADVGHYSNLGDRGVCNGYRGGWEGRSQREPWAVLAFQKLEGLVQDDLAGPLTKRALQRKVGVTADSVLGPVSWRAIQKRIGTTVDATPGVKTWHALSAWIEGGAL